MPPAQPTPARALAPARPNTMHAAAFGLKRAFQATLNITRPTFDRVALTAARFDMLRAIQWGPPCGIHQRDLRRKLGVSGATVSRMLGALEALTLVQRRRDFQDGRQKIVEITRLGRRMLGRAARAIFPFARRAFLFALAAGSHDDWVVRMGEAESVLFRVREAFNDSGDVFYPWHPDD